MTAEEIFVAGSTGVASPLRIAGPGTRSYAFVIDWHIRVLLALSWLLVGLVLRTVLAHGDASALRSRAFEWGVLAPAALIYVLYHPVLEVALRGRTPGKVKAGARIVTREGLMPGTGPLLVRNLFRLIDSLPLLYVVGLVCCFVTARRLRFGDLAAGTVLVVQEASGASALGRLGGLFARSDLKADAHALVRDLINRWPELAAERRVTLARTVLSRLDTPSRAADLGALDERALRSRLEALLSTSAE